MVCALVDLRILTSWVQPGGGKPQQGALQCSVTAKVAKLVDAPGLGPDAVTGVRVRVPPFAPFIP